ncbi:MAG: exo-alpha-sialidase [Archangium sp.]|nr:exo-alpha-sialidase [Archangium sp.]
MKSKILGALLAVIAAGCGLPPSQLTCGDGTTLNGKACVPISTLRCASGTHEENGECLADQITQVTCGVGTHLDGTACVIDTPATVLSPWSAPSVVCQQGMACSDPTLVLTPAGAVVAVSEVGDAAQTVAVFRQGTAGFELAKRFEGNSSIAITPTLAIRGSTLYLAYTDYEPSQTQRYGTGDLMLSISSDFGATWSAPRRINAMPATTLLYSPRLTVSSDGIDLLYIDTDGVSTQDNFLIHSSDDGVTFGEPVALPSGGTYDSLSPAAPAIRVGNVLEVPMIRSGYDLATGGSLSTVEVLSISPDPQTMTMVTQTTRVKRVFSSRDFPLDPVPVLDASATGVRCLAYIDAPSRDYSIYVVRSEGPIDATIRPVLVPGGPGSVQTAPSIAVTPEGDCALAWLDNRSGAWELYESTLLANGTWRAPVKVSPMSFTEDGVTHSLATKVSLRIEGTRKFLAWTDFHGPTESISFSSAPLVPQ